MSPASSANARDSALLTIVAWPPGWSPAQRMEALVRGLGSDPADARALAALEAPCAAGWHPALIAREKARGLRDAGVPAMVSPLETLEDLGRQRVRAKRLAPALGAPEPMYLVEPWDQRLPSLPLRMADVALIVRGQVRVTQATERDQDEVDPTLGGSPTAWALGQHELTPPPDGNTVGQPLGGPARRVLETGEIIDLYRDGYAPIRIDGRKFGYDVLGSARGLTDRVNADRLALRLAEEAAGAQVDLGFAAWKPPGLAGGSRRHDELPVFDLYSAWKAHLDAALRAARAKLDGAGKPKSGAPASQ